MHDDIESAVDGHPPRPVPVPGLVDGLVTAAVDEDGSISVHLIIGSPNALGEGCPHIELVLGREQVGILGETLLGVCRPRATPADPETPPVPCCIGISLDSAVSAR